MFKAEAH